MQESTEKVSQMEEELRRLMAGLGARVELSNSKTGAWTQLQGCNF